MHHAAAVTVLSCLFLAACGGSGGDATPSEASPRSGMTLEELWRVPGDDVAVVPGTSDHQPGEIRVSFLVVDGEGRPVTLPTARVWLARGLREKPFLETTAKLERIGVPGGAEDGHSTHIYVTHVRVSKPGTYWLLAEPEGGPKDVQALGNVVVDEKTSDSPAVGDPAPRSETPTLASAGGNAARLTTRTPPDLTLLKYSVSGSLRERRPFVVTFATPKFCVSRACGPVVDVVEEVARRLDHEVRFIHVEVYEDNDPAQGYNRWMQEWGLTTEPWTFVVGADGKISERFEGLVSVHELEAAAQAVAVP